MKKLPTKKKAPRKRGKSENGAAADWIGEYADDPDEVGSFCERHALFQDGHFAVTLVKKHLEPRRLRVVVEADPEGSGEWLVLDAEVAGLVEEVLASYRRTKEQWLAHLPLASRGLFRLVYNIV